MTDQHTYTIVVGVDGSPASKAALRWALWQADLVHGRIIALRSWEIPGFYGWDARSPEELTNETAAALEETVTDIAGDTALDISNEVRHGHPARALLDTAYDNVADLLVVGSRGHGGFTGALLGSVSQHVVHYATCPVVIIREQST